MPRRCRAVGHAVEGRDRGEGTPTTAGCLRSTARRRRDGHRRSTVSLMLATVVFLVVDVSSGDRPSSGHRRSSEDWMETKRRPATSRVVDAAADSRSMIASEDNMRHNRPRISDVGLPDDAENEFYTDSKQSVS